MTRITEVSVNASKYDRVQVRWSPDGRDIAPEIGLRTKNNGDTASGYPVNLKLDAARELVELLHEAISAVAAWEAEKAASR